jgi:dihydrofolate reductase
MVPPPFELFPSLDAALEASKNDERVFVIGGAIVFKEAFERGLVDEAYETLVHAEVDGDTFFTPPFDKQWELTEIDARQADDRNEFAFTFRNWKKK